ncbi:recombinase family protein [Actinomycetospora soli]|uniref:recombinase family protein n=1 Tax=Actinomycetospora soli TaxID=2893887 RepID=UPI001E2D89B4|nr:recombinase family protein [Actinomycetospora soli]MCD2191660.1 recombinase family protein [Actinomycetospora soli]
MTTVAPTGVLLGYARVSTERQSLDQQLDALAAAGVEPERVWTEKASGKRDDRPQLAALLAYAREGDTVVVWRLDRLGRSLSHIVRTVADLTERGVHVRSITDGADSSTSTGRMMIGILATLAEYERELINERAAIAREARAARGKPVGRPSALTDDQTRQLRVLRAAGETIPALVQQFGVSRATVYRALDGQ